MLATDSDEELLLAVCRNNLSAFIQKAVDIVSPGCEYQHNWHIDAMAYQLEEVKRGKNTRLVINLPPRYLKSTAVSVALPAFLLGHDPTKQVIVLSYGKELAVELTNQTRLLMQSEFYLKLFPGTRLSDKKNTEQMFKTTENGFRFGTSMGGPLLGLGADVIVIDDPVKPEDMYSDSTMQKANAFLSTTLPSRLNDKEHGSIILVMQRLGPNDPAGHALEAGPWRLLRLPMIGTHHEVIQTGPDSVIERQPGDLLHIERDDLVTVSKIRSEIGEHAFSAQYQQLPVLPCGNLFKLEQFQRYDELPPSHYFQCIVQSWDTAVTAAETSDYSVCTTWAKRGDKYYLIDVFRKKLDYPDLEDAVWDLYDDYGPPLVIIEGSHIGMALYSRFWRERLFEFRTFTPKGQKEERAAHQSAKIAAGRVFLPTKALWLDVFEKEVREFPVGRYDDQVDSMVQFLKSMDFPIPNVTR